MFLPVETLDEHQRTLREMYQHVTAAPSALMALASAQADLDLPLCDPTRPDLNPNFDIDTKQTQRDRKVAQRRKQDASVKRDTDGLSGVSVLSSLGYALPTSQAQAEEFAERILKKCQTTLNVSLCRCSLAYVKV